MDVLNDPVRDIAAIRLSRGGRVREVDAVVPWELVDDAGCPVGPVQRYLRDLVGADASTPSWSITVGWSASPSMSTSLSGGCSIAKFAYAGAEGESLVT